MNHETKVVTCLSVFLLQGVLGVFGTVVPRMDLERLIVGSDRIVHARCIKTQSFLERESGTIWTENHLEVLDVLKGEFGTRVVVTEPGGVVGLQGQWVPGAPQFIPGEESVLFLSPTVTGKWRVLGWGQGYFRVRQDTRDGRSVVRQQLAGIELADTGAPPNRALDQIASGYPETLSQFKDHVRLRLRELGAK